MRFGYIQVDFLQEKKIGLEGCESNIWINVSRKYSCDCTGKKETVLDGLVISAVYITG